LQVGEKMPQQTSQKAPTAGLTIYWFSSIIMNRKRSYLMKVEVSHSFEDETIEAKVRWFKSLSIPERMEMLCFFTDMILENNPEIAGKRDVKSITKRIQVLEKT
jgi:hypothetical protein